MKKIYLTMALCLSFTGLIKAQTPVYLDESKPIEQRVEDALSRMTLQEKLAVIHAQSKFSSAGIKRLGFPDFWTDDGPHGVRPDVLWDQWEQAGQSNDSCVAFPALTCLAATWNPEMALLYGESLGEEALYRGKNMILGPGVNIYRTPLNGRTSSIWARTLISLPESWCHTSRDCNRKALLPA
jgi:beta-glucosidase